MAEYKLLTVLFKQNNPYGGYVAGDTVQTYWDDASANFKVYKNGVLASSGNDIPQTFYYNGNYSIYYKSESLEQLLICSGTSKLKYTRQSAFPYLEPTFLTNHPSCNIPVVCDLQFTSLPVITNASSSTSEDGSIVVSATSSNGAIQYAINRDFAYGAGQTSATFSNLKPGTYTVYARDAVNCRATITTKIGVAASYGTLYRCQYVTRTGDTHKTEIKEKGYSGAIIDVEGGIPPTTYRLRGEGERDKFITVLPGEMEINFISETDNYYESIYTNDPEKYRMVHSINGTAVWTGKVLTNQYEESYINPPYPVNIVATDALPQLQDILFLDDFGNMLTGEYKQIVVIAFIMRKLGLNLSIRSGCNIFADSMNKTASDDPLDQAYINVDRYYKIQNNPTCWDVLHWILEPYNAQVIQWNNCWNIIRVEERTANWNYREYNSNGTYVTNGAQTSLIALKNSSYNNRMVWANQNQRLRIMPGFGSVRLIYNLGNKYNIFDNGDFKLTSRLNYDMAIGDETVQLVPDLNGFQVVNSGGTGVYVGYEQLEQSNIAVAFTTFGFDGFDYLISDNINLKMGTIDKLRINVRFKVSRSIIGQSALYDFRYVRVRFKIRYGNYFLQNNGFWTTDDGFIVYYLDKDKANEFVEYEIICNAPADPATLLPSTDFITGQTFNVSVYFPNANEVEFSSSTTSAAIAALRNKATIDLPIGTRTEVYDITGTYTPTGFVGNYILYYELKEDKNSETLADIVRPSDYNATTNPVQWVLQGIQKFDNAIVTTISIDKITAEVLSEGRSLPDYKTIEQSMENENTTPIQKEIIHGSLTNTGRTFFVSGISLGFGIDVLGQNGSVVQFSDNTWQTRIEYVANAGDIAYNGYISNASGVGYSNWGRVAFGESKPLENIFCDVYSAQYNKPWRMLSGSMYSDDKFFSPINALQETIDNNRVYMPVSLTIDFYANMYECEFLELFDINDYSAVGFSEGFTIGFNS